MSDKSYENNGYKPQQIEKGYKPSEQSQPAPSSPVSSEPGFGYVPTSSQGSSSGNPPKKP